MRTKGEVMAHLVAWRQTHGWGKLCDAIGTSEFERRTGLDRVTVRKGLEGIAEQGVVLVESTTQFIPAGKLSLRRRYTWPINERVEKKLNHPEVEPGGGLENNLPPASGTDGRVGEKVTHPVGEKVTHGGVKKQPTQSCTLQSGTVQSSKATKADTPPTNCKKRNSPVVSDSVAAKQPTKEPAYRGDWDDDELEAVQDFIDEHEPDDTDDHGQGEWAAEATLNAGMGAEAAEVVAFLETMVQSGWTAPNYRAFPAVVHHEFERRRNKAIGARWSASDLAKLRAGVKEWMEGDEPPERFEESLELRANGATAQQVFHLLNQRWADPKYKADGKNAPRKWAWFLTVIGKEFSELERNHLPEQPAAAGPNVEQEYNHRAIAAIELPDAEAGAAA